MKQLSRVGFVIGIVFGIGKYSFSVKLSMSSLSSSFLISDLIPVFSQELVPAKNKETTGGEVCRSFIWYEIVYPEVECPENWFCCGSCTNRECCPDLDKRLEQTNCQACLGYISIYGWLNQEQMCDVYCCGQCDDRYCCITKPLSLNQSTCTNGTRTTTRKSATYSSSPSV